MRRRLLYSLAASIAVVVAYAGWFATPPGPRSLRVFDDSRMADLELDMWQTYYAHAKVRLFSLHEQNRYPWVKAAVAGFHLARAAAARIVSCSRRGAAHVARWRCAPGESPNDARVDRL